MRKFGPALLASLTALGGCAALNEGEVSFRRAEPATGYRQAPATPTASDRPDPPILAVPLIRQNISLADAGLPVRPIAAGTQLSIRLDYGFIDGSMSELPFTPSLLGSGSSIFKRRGEVVALANAFEFDAAPAEAAPAAAGEGDGAPATPATPQAQPNMLRFDETSLENARVVFYSNDVQSGQSLNFSNIPLLGPISYHGRPIGIQLIILEIDNTSDQMEGLLERLAAVGANAAGLDGPLSDALVSLGASLVTADDILFRYTMVLDPAAHSGGPAVSVLEPGRLVFFRRQQRGEPVPWSHLRLDHNDGRLYEINEQWAGCSLGGPADTRRQIAANASCYAPFLQESYLTLNVIDHGADAPAATYNYQTLADLRTALAEDEREERGSTEAIVAALEEDAAVYAAHRTGQEASAHWRAARSIYELRYAPLLRPQGMTALQEDGRCPGDPENLAAERRMALYEAHTSVQRYWQALRDAFDEKAHTTDEMKQFLLSGIADFALAESEAEGVTANELTPTAFKQTFLDPESADLLMARLDRAAQSRAMRSCPSRDLDPGL